MKYAYDFDTLYRHVGSICVRATDLEHELEDSVVLLAGGLHTDSIVRGQRGSNLISALRRLMNDGAVSSRDTERIRTLAKRSEKLLGARDQIVHSVWMKTNQNEPGFITGTHTKASKTTQTMWSLEMLAQVRRDLEETQTVLGTVVHNAVAASQGWGLLPEDDLPDWL